MIFNVEAASTALPIRWRNRASPEFAVFFITRCRYGRESDTDCRVTGRIPALDSERMMRTLRNELDLR